MNKHANRIPVGLALALGSLSAYAAFAPNSTLTIEQGSNFTMEVAPNFQLTTAVAGHAGIVVGTAQNTGASHSGSPTGTEVIPSSIDKPWVFFSNTGLDFTVKPVDIVSASGNKATVDFSGWRVTWNGVPAINMGGGSWGSNPSGVANITFGNDGSDGDTYTLRYTATVPRDGQTNFGGVHYGLTLKGHVVAPPTDPATQAPVIDAIPSNLTAVPGAALTYKLTALSPQDHAYTWQATGLPTGASLAPPEGSYDPLTQKWTATLNWTATAEQIGRHPISFNVKDNNTGLISATQSTVIDVVSFAASTVPFDANDPAKRIVIAAARFDQASSKLLVKGRLVLKPRKKLTGKTISVIDAQGALIGTATVNRKSAWKVCVPVAAAVETGALVGAQYNGLVGVRKVAVARKLKYPCR